MRGRGWRGKVNAAGQIQCEVFDTSNDLNKAFNSLMRSKTSGGYSAGPLVRDVATDYHELTLKIGRTIVPRMSNEAIVHLDPSIDVSTRRDPGNAGETEGGIAGVRKTNIYHPTMEDIQREKDILAEVERVIAAEKAEQYKSNPNYGRF